MAPPSERRRLAAGLLWGATLAAVLGLLTWRVARTGTGAFDREATLRLCSAHWPGGAGAARWLTSFGASWFVYPAALLAAIALARRDGVASALALATGVVAAGVSQSLLKLAVSRPRPDLIAPLVAETTFSFPSGHAAMSAAFYGGLAAAVFRRTENRAVRAAAVASAALAVGTVGLTRVILGVHWASDVAAGILIGLFWVAVLAGTTPPAGRRR